MDMIEKEWVEGSKEHRMETNQMLGKPYKAPDTGFGHLVNLQEYPQENNNTKSYMV